MLAFPNCYMISQTRWRNLTNGILCHLDNLTIKNLHDSSGTLGLDDFAEMHLRPDPLFSIPSDNIYLTCMTGTHSGRIFLGGKDGCVYEVIYQVNVKFVNVL